MIFLRIFVLFQNLITENLKCPVLFSSAWVHNVHKCGNWEKAFLLLYDKCIYLCHKIDIIAATIKGLKQNDKKSVSTIKLELKVLILHHSFSKRRSYLKI